MRGGLAHTDPDELLEVYDDRGQPTGVAKARGAIHRDGDWHLAFFCWIVRRGGGDEVEVVLQKRADDKDVWPGRFDASAAGHVRYGETTAEAAREIEEELGLHVDVAELEPLMRHRQEHVHESGLVDRELHDVHLLRCELPLEAYRPGPEVAGIVSVPIDDVLELVAGRRASIETTLHPAQQPVTLRASDLVPYDVAYWEAIAYSGRASIARR
jgi:isopentenyldiphosphate isomerase